MQASAQTATGIASEDLSLCFIDDKHYIFGMSVLMLQTPGYSLNSVFVAGIYVVHNYHFYIYIRIVLRLAYDGNYNWLSSPIVT